MPSIARKTLSRRTLSGMKIGITTCAMNRIVTNGTPRTVSIYAVETHLTTGKVLRRPNANRTPSGKQKQIPTDARIRVSRSPPQFVVRIAFSPKPRSIISVQGKESIHPMRTQRRIFGSKPRPQVPRKSITASNATPTSIHPRVAQPKVDISIGRSVHTIPNPPMLTANLSVSPPQIPPLKPAKAQTV